MSRRYLVAAALSLTPGALMAQELSAIDPHVRVEAQGDPPTLRLRWPALSNVTGFTVSRRAQGERRWEVVGRALPADADRYEDTSVERGRLYEYEVRALRGAPIGTGRGYVLAGADVAVASSPGAALVVVDRATRESLTVELDRLRDDLRDEAWDARELVVEPMDTPALVRTRIREARDAAPDRAWSVLLFGRVPRAFSGSINPDGHPDHLGAWPADGYFAELDDEWTDEDDLGGAGAFANRARDGRFDFNVFPSELEVALGRVDARELPAFAPLGEVELLRRYLARDHAWRKGELVVAPRTWVSDAFGFRGGEAFARIAWRDGVPMFGSEPERGRGFFDALESAAGGDGGVSNGYRFAVGVGGGTPTSANGVGTTADFVRRAPRTVFLALFGSYFGDWSYPDNFMRAALVGPGSVLATTWCARPYAHLHGLGAMQTFGQAFLAGANNDGDYDEGSAAHGVHQALLGDPTLRLFVAVPPGGVTLRSVVDGAEVSWREPNRSEGQRLGYAVSRREDGDASGYEPLFEGTLAGTSYIDRSAHAGTRYEWRVVSVERVVTGSGSFALPSAGARVAGAWTRAVSALDGGAGVDGGVDAAIDVGPSAMPEGGCGCRALPVRPGDGVCLAMGLLGCATRRRRLRGRRSRG